MMQSALLLAASLLSALARIHLGLQSLAQSTGPVTTRRQRTDRLDRLQCWLTVEPPAQGLELLRVLICQLRDASTL